MNYTTNSSITVSVTDSQDTIQLTKNQLIVISIAAFLVLIGNLCTNTTAIYSLITTKQINNASSRMVLILSISDVLVATDVQMFSSCYYIPKMFLHNKNPITIFWLLDITSISLHYCFD